MMHTHTLAAYDPYIMKVNAINMECPCQWGLGLAKCRFCICLPGMANAFFWGGKRMAMPQQSGIFLARAGCEHSPERVPAGMAWTHASPMLLWPSCMNFVVTNRHQLHDIVYMTSCCHIIRSVLLLKSRWHASTIALLTLWVTIMHHFDGFAWYWVKVCYSMSLVCPRTTSL